MVQTGICNPTSDLKTRKMKVLLIICAVAVSVTASTRRDPLWAAYKKSFNKLYARDIEDSLRHRIWLKNLHQIEIHNLKANFKNFSYRLGVNAYSDLTDLEFKRRRGLRMDLKKRGPTGLRFIAPNNLKIPESIDWRTKGYVTPVKNQGACGSCWAFSATGSLEGQHFRKTGELVSLSEQNLVDCSTRYGNQGCAGGLMNNAFVYIEENHGIDTELSYPYTATDGNCRFKRIDVGATDHGFFDIPPGNETKLQIACAAVGPISIGIDASDPTFRFYKSGVYQSAQCSNQSLNHAMLVVGYGSFEGVDYWLVKNSWGPSWGMSGYIMMARNKGNMCGIATLASYPIV